MLNFLIFLASGLRSFMQPFFATIHFEGSFDVVFHLLDYLDSSLDLSFSKKKKEINSLDPPPFGTFHQTSLAKEKLSAPSRARPYQPISYN